MAVPSGRPTAIPSQSSGGSPPGNLSAPPTNSEIEQVIQMATSSRNDGRLPTGRDTRTQLFVGNLPYRVRWQDLKDLFRKAGTVLRADVSLGPDNRSRGYGTVLLATAEDAGRAIDMFNGYVWQTRTLEVRPDRLPPDFDVMNPSAAGTSHHPTSYPMPSLHSMPYVPPPPHSASIVAPSVFSGNQEDPIPRPRSGSMVYPSTHVLPYPMPLHTQALSRAQSSASRSIFVGNLPFHCQWQELKDLFRVAGPIARADVALGPDGRSRGFGTVVFTNEPDAERAVEMFNGYEFQGRVLKVHYDKYSNLQSQGSSAVPSPGPSMMMASHPAHPGSIILPPMSYGPPSGPPTPYEYPPHLSSFPPPQAQGQQPTASQVPSSPQRSTYSPPASSSSAFSASSPRQQAFRIAPGPPTPGGVVPMSPNSQAHAHPHPAHPGPIALPTGPPHLISPAMTHQLGLPPITPSMPSFTFLPQTATPPLHAHFLSPGIGPFSPALGSPGGFFRPQNPYFNLAPGAPVHNYSASPGHVLRQDSSGYFDAAPAVADSYFAGAVISGEGDATSGSGTATGSVGHESSSKGSSAGGRSVLGLDGELPQPVFASVGLGLEGFKDLSIRDRYPSGGSGGSVGTMASSAGTGGSGTGGAVSASLSPPSSLDSSLPQPQFGVGRSPLSNNGSVMNFDDGKSEGGGAYAESRAGNNNLAADVSVKLRRASWTEERDKRAVMLKQVPQQGSH